MGDSTLSSPPIGETSEPRPRLCVCGGGGGGGVVGCMVFMVRSVRVWCLMFGRLTIARRGWVGGGGGEGRGGG
jgi:hypothetical protein